MIPHKSDENESTLVNRWRKLQDLKGFKFKFKCNTGNIENTISITEKLNLLVVGFHVTYRCMNSTKTKSTLFHHRHITVINLT